MTLSVEMPEPEPEPELEAQELVGEQSSSKRKLDELFFLWLGLPETSELVTGLVQDMRAGKSVPLSRVSSLDELFQQEGCAAGGSKT